MPVIAPKGLSHIAIRAEDVPRSAAFYEHVFGYQVFLDERDKDANPRTMGVIGGAAVEIVKSAKPHARVDEEVPGYAVMSFSVDDIDAARAALAEAGVPRVGKVLTMGDVRLIFLRDPDGILLEIIQLRGGAASMAEIGAKALARAGA
jgi:catechol 2,3-dioxygenase-like lactoylglutathione lyase family enzyme